MSSEGVCKAIFYFTALIWIINGLFCKILNLVPRHEQIVARILGSQHSGTLTILIGISEVLMAIWILSRIHKRFCAITQMVVVAFMNILEFVLVPDLLLWGKLNSVFALLFIMLIYTDEFSLNRN